MEYAAAQMNESTSGTDGPTLAQSGLFSAGFDGPSLLVVVGLSLLTLVTIVGNTLVIVAVARTRRLRSVTNCFVASLAVSDLCVGCAVMPVSIAYETLGQWPLGRPVCELWSSLDVLLCTASILNLCCISLDRYFAITRPLTYTVKRNKRLAAAMIAVVWVLAAVITLPPLIGLYDRHWETDSTRCEYVSDKSYVVYSACGSFYIPLLVMLFVYSRILMVIYRRNKVVRQTKQIQQRHQPTVTMPSHGKPCASSMCASAPVCSWPNSVQPFKDFRSSASDCLEMVSDSYLVVRTQARVGSADDSVCNVSSGRESMTTASLFRSRSCQFHFADSQWESCSSGYAFGVHYRKRSSSGSAQLDTSTTSHSDKYFLGDSSVHVAAPTLSSDSSTRRATPKMLTVPSNDSFSFHNAVDRFPSTLVPARTGKKAHRRRREDLRRTRVRGLRMSFRKETKATTTLAVVVGGFVICWVPFFAVYIVIPFCSQCYFPQLLLSCLTWLGWINSAINPFIYAFYSLDFRTAFWQLTFGRFQRHKLKTRKTMSSYPQVWRSRLPSGGPMAAFGMGMHMPPIITVQSAVI